MLPASSQESLSRSRNPKMVGSSHIYALRESPESKDTIREGSVLSYVPRVSQFHLKTFDSKMA